MSLASSIMDCGGSISGRFFSMPGLEMSISASSLIRKFKFSKREFIFLDMVPENIDFEEALSTLGEVGSFAGYKRSGRLFVDNAL